MNANTFNVLLFCAVLGLAVGVGVFTFGYAEGASYLTNDPAACANCHVMETHFASWAKSSHKGVAACNDCHTPPGVVPKYLSKASNGFWHSLAFTTGEYPDPLQIKAHNLEITEQACATCHEDVVTAITSGTHMTGTDPRPALADGNRLPRDVDEVVTCTRCHNSVGHWVR